MITLTIPERVWDDYLNPDVSSMESELGLRALRAEPFYRKRGKGGVRVYDDVLERIALELAEYLHDRSDTLLGQSIADPYDPFEKADRATQRRAMKLAAEITESCGRGYYVEIVIEATGEVTRRTGPYSSRRAEKIASGLERNMSEQFYVRVDAGEKVPS
jgi:hypothetical protein